MCELKDISLSEWFTHDIITKKFREEIIKVEVYKTNSLPLNECFLPLFRDLQKCLLILTTFPEYYLKYINPPNIGFADS